MDDHLELRAPGVIVRSFNKTIRELIGILAKKSTGETERANLNLLQKRISALLLCSESELLKMSSPFFLIHADQIIKRDEGSLFTTDFRAEYLRVRGSITREDEFALRLIDPVREHYGNSTVEERNYIYLRVKSLLDDCIEYALVN